MRWRRGGGLAAVLALLVVGWVALVARGGGLGDHQRRRAAFDKAVDKAVAGALSAVRTAHLAGQADLDGRVTRAFVASVLGDALEGVDQAQRQLSETPPPGTVEAVTRDRLLRLLGDASSATGELVAAADRGDEAAIRAAVHALGPIGDRLAGFVERHRL